jgi:hypothetical protein
MKHARDAFNTTAVGAADNHNHHCTLCKGELIKFRQMRHGWPAVPYTYHGYYLPWPVYLYHDGGGVGLG